MPSASIMDRVKSGTSAVRLVLVPKGDLLARTVSAGPHEDRAAALEGTKTAAKLFRREVDPALAKLSKIGLVNAEKLGAGARLDGNIEKSGLFDNLSLFKAIAVRAKDEQTVDRVLDATSDQFDAVLDVRSPSDTGISAHADRRPSKTRAHRLWPRASGVQEAWDLDIRGNGVIVGVLDTGIDADHVEFKQNRVEFRYVPPGMVETAGSLRNVRGFDTDGHGTHVCGIIAGKNVGLARDVDLHVASVIESETLRASLWRTVYGIDWMFRRFLEPQYVNRPCVVNLSLCFYEDMMSAADLADWKLVLSRAIDDLHDKDALVVAAAGNRGVGLLGFPAGFDGVLAVGAVDVHGRVPEFSGPPTKQARRDIYGYGVDIQSSVERDRDGKSFYVPSDGTSMAAPYVTGIAAMLRQTKPAATAMEVREHILATAQTGIDGVPIARFAHW